MAAGGYIGNGQRVAFATGSPHTWKKLEQVMECQIPSAIADDIETTVHGSTGFKSYIPGLKKVGDTVVKMLRDQSRTTAPNQNALWDLLGTQNPVWIRIENPDGPDLSVANWEAYEFQVRVKSWQAAAPIGDKQAIDAALLFSGTSFSRYDPTTSAIG